MSPDPVAALLEHQSGVVSRRQVLAAGWRPHDVRRMLRRREWAALHPGVYVDHTGEPTWVQRAWAAVLAVWPAALDGDSALRATAGPGWRGREDGAPILVAVGRGRTVEEPDGVRVRHVTRLDQRARWNARPPRLRFEEAALDAALARDLPADRVEALARAVRSRCTTAERLLAALDGRARVPNRRWLHDVLVDVRDGTMSVLEHGYLVRVERPHGLPRARRQGRDALDGGVVHRDVEYDDLGLVVELDGRTDHRGADRARDLDRDLALAATGRLGVRVGWSQVFGTPCRTAARVGELLRRRGWPGAPVPCGPGCTLREAG